LTSLAQNKWTGSPLGLGLGDGVGLGLGDGVGLGLGDGVGVGVGDGVGVGLGVGLGLGDGVGVGTSDCPVTTIRSVSVQAVFEEQVNVYVPGSLMIQFLIWFVPIIAEAGIVYAMLFLKTENLPFGRIPVPQLEKQFTSMAVPVLRFVIAEPSFHGLSVLAS
jgi:hypothetical protein